MSTRSWIRNRFTRTPHTTRNKLTPFRPSLEVLEDRLTPAGPTFSLATLPNGTYGTPYDQSIQITEQGYTGNFTLSQYGTLPTSMNLESILGVPQSVRLYGTPNGAGSSFSWTVSATDDAGNTTSQTYAWTVDQAILKITANNQTKPYGAPLPPLTVSYSGFVNGDTAASLTTQPSVSTTASASSSVTAAGYPITASGAVDSNYAISYQPGTLTITPKTLLVTGLSATNKTYDATNADPLSGTAALLAAEAAGSGSSSDGRSYTGDSVLLGGTAVGTFAQKDVGTGLAVSVSGHTLTGAQAGDYVLSSTDEENGALTAGITPKTLTYSGLSVPASRMYNGETNAVVSGTAVLQTPESPGTGSTSDGKPYSGDAVGLTGTPTGTYNSKDVATATTVTFGGLSQTGANSADYSLTAGTQAATITPQTVLASINGNPTKPYDGTPSATLTSANFSLSGLAGTESFTVTQTSGVYNSPNVATATTVKASLTAGDFTPANGTLASNYALPSTASGPGQITPASLTVQADSNPATPAQDPFTKVYGSADPILTYRATGLQFTDTAASVLSGYLSRASGESVGSYAVTQGSLTANSNYTLSFTPGTLSITPAPLTVQADSNPSTAAQDPFSKVYGSADPMLTYRATGFQFSDTAASVLSGFLTRDSGENVGSYAVKQGTLAANNNYTLSFSPGTLSITPATLTVTADADANAANGQTAFSKTYGTTLSFAGTEFTTSGLVNGDAVTSVSLASNGAAAGASVAGSPYAVLISNAVGTGLGNYTLHYANGTLTVNPAALSATPVNFSATAGAPFSGTVATFTTPERVDGAAAFTATITWEDGSTSSGVITAITGSPGSFTVSGNHTFAAAGTYTTISVKITNPNTQSATALVTATVTGLGQGVTKGLTGGIGFWQGPQGQALITGFNITPSNSSPTALAGWLKGTFPNLYGGLALTSNADVAAYFQVLFNQAAKATGTKAQVLAAQAPVQVLATALNVYATTLSLGGTAGVVYGFTVSTSGLSAYSFNVGGDGAAFGVANNAARTVYALLVAVNNQAKGGVLYGGDGTLQGEAADLFTALNQAGNIG